MVRGLCLGVLAAFCAVGCDSNSGFSGSSKSPSSSTTAKAATPAPTPAPAPAAAQTAGASPVLQPPTNAIVKGHFTLWAVPNHPQPEENYQLYCQVTLPTGVSGYSSSDLTGQIRGTDKYFQPIGPAGDPTKQQFTINSASALLVIAVPGARPNVQDSISISSGLLGETQTASLVFGY